MVEFIELHLKKTFLEQQGLPDIGYPVPADEFEQVLGAGEIDLPWLLCWLQLYRSGHPGPGADLDAAMLTLAGLIAPRDQPTEIDIGGDSWSLRFGPVDLGEEIVTIQRQEELLASLRPLADGRLVVSTYRALDAKACRYLMQLGARPHPELGVNMRANNWEYALDNSAGMGNMYADQAGEAYLSYWSRGLGLDNGGQPVGNWYALRRREPVAPALAAFQVGVCYELGQGS